MGRQGKLIAFAAIAVVLVGAAFWVADSRRPQQSIPAAGSLLPQLQASLNDIDQVRIVGAGDAVLVTLVLDEGVWTVEQRGGHPADFGKLREFLLQLAHTRRVEAKTARPESHAALGVEDVAAADADGVRVELGGIDPTLAVIIGDNNQRGDGTYVRVADDPQSWLASQNIAVERDPARWLRREIADIASTRLQRLRIAPAEGEAVEIARAHGGMNAKLEVQNLPSGREVASEFVAEAPAGLFSGLRADDILPAAETVLPDTALSEARYVMHEGLAIDITSWQEGGRTLARFRAELDEAAAAEHIVVAQQRAANEYAALVAARTAETEALDALNGDSTDVEMLAAADDSTAPDNVAEQDDVPGSATAVAGANPDSTELPEQPLALSNPEADREQRLTAIRDEAEKLNQRFDGWTFVLPAHKATTLSKPLADYVKATGAED